MSNRQLVVAAADAKVKQPAPVYMDWFGWQPPLLDGRMRAFHCLDICFWFYNTDLMLTHTGALVKFLVSELGHAASSKRRSKMAFI